MNGNGKYCDERERDEFEGDEITVVSHGNYLTSLLNKDPPCVFV